MTTEERQSSRLSTLAGIAVLLALTALVVPVAGQEEPAVEATVAADDAALDEVVEAAESESAEEPAPGGEPGSTPEPAEDADEVSEPAPAEEAEAPTRIDRYDTSVQIFSSLTVEEDEVYNEAVAILGPLNIHGVVKGDAVAVGGPVEVTGEVGGELVSVGGPVRLASTARVGKLVNVGGTLTKEDGAVVSGVIENHGGASFSIDLSEHGVRLGDRDEESHGDRHESGARHRSRYFHRVTDFIGGLAWRAVALALLLFVLAVAGVLAPRLIDRAERKLNVDPWKAAVAGLLTEIGFLPALVAGCIFLVISIVGIFLVPVFIPLMLLALVVAFVVGFAAVAQRVGRLIGKRFDWQLTSRVPQIAIGVIGLYTVSFIGWILSMLPGPFSILGWGTEMIGALILYIAWTVGLGALLLAAFDPPPADAESAAQPTQPPPPLPTAGEGGESPPPDSAGPQEEPGDDDR